MPLAADAAYILGGLGCLFVGIGIGYLVARARLSAGFLFSSRDPQTGTNSKPPSLDEIAQLPLMLMKLNEQLPQTPAIKNQFGEILRLAELQESDIERIVRDSRTDALTGLWNRRALDEQTPLQFNLAHRYGTPLCVVMIDIDHFKQLNDKYGHAIGDAALRHVATVLQRGLRDSDFIARYGGEEFALLLIQTDLAGALIATERLRKLIMDTPFLDGEQAIEIRVSMGIGQSRGEEHFNEVFARADAALLNAKQAGRNQVQTETGWSGTLANPPEVAH